MQKKRRHRCGSQRVWPIKNPTLRTQDVRTNTVLARPKPSVVDALLLTIRPISIAEAVRKRHGQITLVHPGNVSGRSELWFPVESEGQTRCVASLAGDWAHWDLRSAVLRQLRRSPKRQSRGSIRAGRARMLRSLWLAPPRTSGERVLAPGAGRRGSAAGSQARTSDRVSSCRASLRVGCLRSVASVSNRFVLPLASVGGNGLAFAKISSPCQTLATTLR